MSALAGDEAAAEECARVLADAEDSDAASAAPDVDRWITPPRNQGQIVEVSYGVDDDGIGWRRSYDRSDREERFERLGTVLETWDPANGEPTAEDYE